MLRAIRGYRRILDEVKDRGSYGWAVVKSQGKVGRTVEEQRPGRGKGGPSIYVARREGSWPSLRLGYPAASGKLQRKGALPSPHAHWLRQSVDCLPPSDLFSGYGCPLHGPGVSSRSPREQRP